MSALFQASAAISAGKPPPPTRRYLFYQLGELQGQSGRSESDTNILPLFFRPVAYILHSLTQVCDRANAGMTSYLLIYWSLHMWVINPLTPNDHYSGRTAPLTSKRFILYIYSTNIGTEYFKHGIYSPFFPLQNAVCFIILTYLVPVLFTFYIQSVLKLKK